jgi:DNA-binding LytR/AlgR family response regulator
MPPSALIAEDEPLLAAALQAELAQAWPELAVVACAADGPAALEQALAVRPDVVFLDIRMPGMNGIEVAEALAEDWADDASLPLVVFVTAYEEYAVRAFEQAAVDYVLKPAAPERLARTCDRLRAALALRRSAGGQAPESLAAVLGQLRGLLDTPAGPRNAGGGTLSVLPASVGATVHMVPASEVLFFEAADKYVRVVTERREYLIRIPLRQLLPQLDPDEFWQVHRSIVVRADAVATAVRSETGRLELTLRGYAGRLEVSRLYAHRFKAL